MINKKEILPKALWVGLIIFAIGTAISISLEELGAFLAMMSFGVLLLTKREKLKFNIIDIPILLIIIGPITSSLIVSPNKLNSLKGNLNDLWMIPLFYVIISSLTIEKYKKILNIVFWVSLIAAIYGIWQSFTGIDFIKHHHLAKWDRLYFASGFWGLHLTYGGFMAMVSVVAFGFALDVQIKKEKIFYYSVALFSLLAAILSFSRSAIVGLFAGLFFFFLINIKRTYKLFIVVLIAVIVIFSLSHSLQDRMHGTLNPNYLQKIYRYQIWMTALNMIKHHPVFGVGANNFSRLYNQYKRPEFDRPPIGHAHNDLLNIYVEGGILGFLGYGSLFFILIFFGIKTFNKNHSNLLVGLVASIVVMFFQGLSQCYFTDAENAWLFWFLASGLWLYVLKNKIEDNL